MRESAWSEHRRVSLALMRTRGQPVSRSLAAQRPSTCEGVTPVTRRTRGSTGPDPVPKSLGPVRRSQRVAVKLLKSRTRHAERRAQRVRVGWAARYRLDSHGPWLECHVIDLSVHGAALELPEHVSAPTSRLLLLDLQCGDDPPGDVVLRAEVRSVSVSENGRPRLGAVFINANSLERRFLADAVQRTADRATWDDL